MPNQTGIKKLKNGRYKARYFAGFDSKGKRQYPARTFDTQTEASKWRTTQLNAKNDGRHYEAHGLTVAKFLDQWLEIKAQALRKKSLEMYRQSLDSYVKPEIGHVKLTRLRPSHIEAMVSQLLQRLSPSTVATARLLLNGSLKKAVRLGLIPSNPVESTDGPKRAKPKRYPLTVEESMRLIDACVHYRFGLFFVFALHTGLRPEEGIGLQWCNLELGERGIVRVSRVVHRTRGGGWQWQEPKTKNSNRRVVFPGWLATMLSEHRKKQLERKLKAGPRWTDNDLVFCTTLGAPIHHCTLSAEFKSVLVTAGLPQTIRQYDLRHSFVTTSLIAGVDPKTVSQEAGHASVAFTLDHYGSVLEEMHVTASDKREGLFKSRAGSK
ncbi:MAG: tyrosine-type recombinase/integrase [Pyrinomonadaceae bacterium]